MLSPLNGSRGKMPTTLLKWRGDDYTLLHKERKVDPYSLSLKWKEEGVPTTLLLGRGGDGYTLLFKERDAEPYCPH